MDNNNNNNNNNSDDEYNEWRMDDDELQMCKDYMWISDLNVTDNREIEMSLIALSDEEDPDDADGVKDANELNETLGDLSFELSPSSTKASVTPSRWGPTPTKTPDAFDRRHDFADMSFSTPIMVTPSPVTGSSPNVSPITMETPQGVQRFKIVGGGMLRIDNAPNTLESIPNLVLHVFGIRVVRGRVINTRSIVTNPPLAIRRLPLGSTRDYTFSFSDKDIEGQNQGETIFTTERGWRPYVDRRPLGVFTILRSQFKCYRQGDMIRKEAIVQYSKYGSDMVVLQPGDAEKLQDRNHIVIKLILGGSGVVTEIAIHRRVFAMNMNASGTPIRFTQITVAEGVDIDVEIMYDVHKIRKDATRLLVIITRIDFAVSEGFELPFINRRRRRRRRELTFDSPKRKKGIQCMFAGCILDGVDICNGCKTVSYCGEEHAKEDWSIGHSIDCIPLTKLPQKKELTYL